MEKEQLNKIVAAVELTIRLLFTISMFIESVAHIIEVL